MTPKETRRVTIEDGARKITSIDILKMFNLLHPNSHPLLQLYIPACMHIYMHIFKHI